METKSTVAVYDKAYRAVFLIPRASIRHLPREGRPNRQHPKRLILCSKFDPLTPDDSCPAGDQCKYVHVDSSQTDAQRQVHVNYAWPSLDEVSVPRFEPGLRFHVAPPNSRVATDEMDSDMALKTKALECPRRPLSHCAHYYFNRTCNLGSECHFIHAVFIDPSAKRKLHVAPPPCRLDEERAMILTKRQRAAQAAAASMYDAAGGLDYAVAAFDGVELGTAGASAWHHGQDEEAGLTHGGPTSDALQQLEEDTTMPVETEPASPASCCSISPFTGTSSFPASALTVDNLQRHMRGSRVVVKCSMRRSASSDSSYRPFGTAASWEQQSQASLDTGCLTCRIAHFRHDPYSTTSSRVVMVRCA